MILDSFSIVAIICEVVFIAAMERLAWKNRQKKHVFWGWLVMMVMLIVIDAVFFSGLLT